MKNLKLIFTLFLLTNLAFSQDLEWAKTIGGSNEDRGYSITVDDAGNVYTIGYFFSGTVDFDPDPNNTENLTSNGSTDIFITKMDAAGNLVWAKNMGGSDFDRGRSIAVDAAGNVYATGYFNGTADFDPGSGMQNLTSSGGNDICIFKLDASGSFLWANRIGGSDADEGYSIALDTAGNVYTTGRFIGTVDFNPGGGTDNLTSHTGRDIFISKLDANGNFLWAKSMGGASNWDSGLSIAVDPTGNIYTTGAFNLTVDFDPNVGTYNLTSNGNFDIFISKLDNSGTLLWANSMGGNGDDRGRSIKVDMSGNVYTTGYFNGTADFDPNPGTQNLTSNGDNDIFISKLDASGDFVWAKSMGGSAGNDVAESIAVDATGNVYTTGYFNGTVDFDPGLGIHNLFSEGGVDIFISKLDSSGNFVWAGSMGGSSITPDHGYEIAVDSVGNIYTTGWFAGTADLDPGTDIHYLPSNGNQDIFISKLSQCLLTTGTGVTQQDATTLLANLSGASYQWIDCANGNTAIPGATAQLFTATANGNYAVIVDNGTCSDTSECFAISTVGVNELNTLGNISIYPNPVSGSLNIEISDIQLTAIFIMDLTGKVLKTTPPNAKTIDVNELASGVYFLQLQTEKGVLNKKFVKK